MIEAHLIDSWTGVPDRNTKLFEWAMVLGGFGAPLFLLLAGVAVSLSAGSKARRGATGAAAALAVMRRGLEIFGLAFLFRVQAWILGWSSYRRCCGSTSSMSWDRRSSPQPHCGAYVRRPRRREVAFLSMTLAMTVLTPIVRTASWLAGFPDPIEAYVRPAGVYSGFPFFPWAGFVFAGAFVGALLDRHPPTVPRADTRANTWFGVGGGLLAVAAYAGSFLPTLYAQSDFWTSSPSFFLIRLGLLVMTVGVAYAWERRPWGRGGWSWSSSSDGPRSSSTGFTSSWSTA